KHAYMIGYMARRVEKTQRQISYAEFLIIFHAKCAGVRRAFMENLRRRSPFDDITVAHDMIRMRMGADDVFHFEAMCLDSLEHALRRVRGIHDGDFFCSFIANEVCEISVAIHTNLLEYHCHCLRADLTKRAREISGPRPTESYIIYRNFPV